MKELLKCVLDFIFILIVVCAIVYGFLYALDNQSVVNYDEEKIQKVSMLDKE